MPNKDGTANVGDALKHIGVALVGALIIVLTGLYLPGFLLVIIPPIVCGVGGWFADKNPNRKTRIEVALAWGGIGLIAGILFWIAR
jgi:hypothetical protein